MKRRILSLFLAPLHLALITLGHLTFAGSPDTVVVFNEIQYNPGGGTKDGEWVEVFNQMGIRTDVSGWRIKGIDYTFPPGTIIDPGACLVVYRNPVAGQLGPFSGSLDNSGELLELVNQVGRLMDELDYRDSGRWPIEADGSGATLAKRRPYSASKPTGNWTFSSQVGGTPGTVNFPGASAAPTILFNEIPPVSGETFWVELVNVGSGAVDIGGFIVSVSGDPAREYLVPEQSLSPGKVLLLDGDALGFRPADNENLFLHDATRETVLDGQRQTGRLRGRSAQQDGVWLYPASPTPGNPNVFAFRDEVVISEIAYNPPASSPDWANSNNQWLEVANRSGASVDLSGWNFSDGIRFTFPAGTLLAAGEHACIARNAAAFSAAYPAARLLGEFGGSLSRSGERIVLSDANDNPVDEVRYHDGGRWPEAPDGGGSTLELRDHDADNSLGESWAASDESGRSPWQTYTYQGVAAASAVGPDNQWRDFIIGLNAAGEVLVDNITVTELSGASPVSMLSNSDFEGDSTGWRFRGNHRHSEVITDPDNPGNQVLRLVATGYTEHMHNNVETTLASGRSVVNGRTYEISFKAKWISGSNQLNTRLYFNRLPRTSLIDRPDSPGTPGVANSRAAANIGPSYEGLTHSPPVPPAGASTTVSVTPSDPDGIGTLTLFYSVEGKAFSSVGMVPGADGVYSGQIPGQAAGAVVQFYVAATDGLGASTFFPAGGADSRALYEVEDGRASGTGLHNFRLIMTPGDDTWMHTSINVMSNDRLGSTVIYNESEIFYDTGVRLKSSQRGRLNSRRVGFNVGFNTDQLFRGVHRTVAVDRSQGQSPGQRELLFNIMMTSAGGISGKYNDLIRIIAPRNAHTGTAELQLARYGGISLGSQLKDGDKGTVFEYELIYYPRNADGNGFKIPQPDGVQGTRVRNLGDDKENYRWNFLIKNNRERDDYAALIAYCKHFDLSGAPFHAGVENFVDVDNWLRGMAFGVLSGAGDNYAANSTHNAQFYVRPDGRVIFLPHDMDFSFSTSRSITANSDVATIIHDPARLRQYLGHLHDIITTTYNNAYMSGWSAHFASLDPGQNWNSSLNHINSRSNNVLSQVTGSIPQVAFNITSSNELTVNGSTATISGVGWIDVRKIRIAGGGELDVTWTSGNQWQLNVQVLPGPNTITLEAVNFSGEVIGTKTITVNNTGSMVPASQENIVVSELLFHPPAPTAAEVAAGFTDESFFEFVELMNIGTVDVNLDGARFTAGINYTLPAFTLAPGARAVLARNRAAFLSRNPGVGAALMPGGYGVGDNNNFSNNGELVVLSTFEGADIHRFTYGNRLSWPPQLPWPGSAGGSGFSAVLNEADNKPDPGLLLDWRSSPLRGKLRVSEISYDPVGGSDHEFIEFVNISGAAIDLQGVRLMPGAPAGEFIFGARTLGVGEHIIVVANRSAFLNHHGQSIESRVAGEWAVGKLGNGGENITVVDKDGNLVLNFSYDDRNGWPGRAAGKGSTLEVIDPAAGLQDPDNWRSSTEYGGSPGVAGNGPSPTVLINEILAHTDVPVLDTIELFNATSQGVDISHWWITDSSDNWKKFQVPAGTTLAAGAYIRFDEKDFNPNGLWNPNPGTRGANEFTLSSTGESIWLIEADASGKLLRFVDKAGFGASLNGVSMGRHTNSLNEVFFPAQLSPTLGAVNSGTRVGPVVISEIMYHPESGNMEWIELQNISDGDVPLFDPNHPANTWRVSGIGFTFPQDVTLDKRGMAILVNGDPDAFRLRHGIEEEVLIQGPFTGTLQDSGERVVLERPDDPNPGDVTPPYVEVDAVRYNDKAPWPTGADGDGFTIVRRNVDRFGTDPAHWKASDDKGGTPGTSFLPPPEPVIRIAGGRIIEVSVGTVYQDLGATAVDDVDGDVSAGITVDASAADTSRTGSFSVWYSVTDRDGNESRKSRTVNVVPLVSPPSFLAHRYSFDGDGTTAPDLVGSADATIYGGARLSGAGFLDLDGNNDYVDLPDGILSALGDATFETWINWRGPSTSQWQRILEFGDDKSNYLYLTPRSSSSASPVRLAFSINGGEKRVNVPVTIPSDGSSTTHLAIVFNDTGDHAGLFIDGKLEGGRTTTVSLSGIDDINNWLGRSQYVRVPYFKGTFHEFRIYKRALSEADVLSSFQKGADKAAGPVVSAFTSATPKVSPGAEATLSWDIADFSSITIDNGVGDVSGETGVAVNPLVTTTYRLTAANNAGSVTIPFTVIVDDGGTPIDDSDGDGWTNDQENFLGTDPLDPRDGFTVQVSSTTAFNPPGVDFEYQLRWQSVIGRTYTIESSSDLEAWAEAAVVNGDGTEKTHSVQSRDAVGFFRLKIE